MDVVIALVALLICSPLIGAIAFLVGITQGRPILFRQWRVGRNGREFQLLKFRTMSTAAAENGPGLTRSGDARVTQLGRWLRKYKLDELPQLLNVVKGDMSLVGPRPDLKQFWEQITSNDKRVLTLTPGLTGAASIAFHDEEKILAKIPPEQLITFYLNHLLPEKARLDLAYAARATFWSDCRTLFYTLLVPIAPQRNSGRTGGGDALNGSRLFS
jgi:lipopolysaccharide/colanic/teichoic acid biosynthesis glycosyltransferase